MTKKSYAIKCTEEDGFWYTILATSSPFRILLVAMFDPKTSSFFISGHVCHSAALDIFSILVIISRKSKRLNERLKELCLIGHFKACMFF